MTLEERIALGEDSTMEMKTVSIPGKRVAKPDAKDVVETWVRDICNDSVKPPLNATIRKLVIKDEKGAADEDSCGRKVTEKVTEKPLEDRVLVAIARNPNQAQRELAAWLGVNRAYLARVMSAMQKRGLIRRIGPDKGGHWEVVGGECA